jgi:hypothetical protein
MHVSSPAAQEDDSNPCKTFTAFTPAPFSGYFVCGLFALVLTALYSAATL